MDLPRWKHTAHMLVVWLALAGACAPRTAAVPQTPASRDAEAPFAAGNLLVASRGLGDPNFRQTVVLLLRSIDDGTAGIVLNRRLVVPINRLLPGISAAPSADALVFSGGPVGLSEVLVLVRSATPVPGATRIIDEVYQLTAREAVDAALLSGPGPDRVRVYAGYAGWGPGQLQAEIDHGAWHVLDGQADVVFDRAHETMWQRLLRRTGDLSARAEEGRDVMEVTLRARVPAVARRRG